MAQGCLYVKPVAGDGTQGTVIKVELPTGVGIAELEDLHLRGRQEARSPGGDGHFVSLGAYRLVTIRIRGLTRASHQDFLDRLWAADSQLNIGALCHFTRDRDKAGVWPVVDALGTSWDVPAQGDTTLYLGDDLVNVETSPTLAVGDDLLVETEPPECHLSTHRLATITAGPPTAITLPASNGVFFTSSAARAVVCWEGFYPHLRLAEASLSRPRLKREGPMSWEWEATFEGGPIGYFNLMDGSGP